VKEENTASRKSNANENQINEWTRPRLEKSARERKRKIEKRKEKRELGPFARGSVDLIGYTSCMVGLKMTVRNTTPSTSATMREPGFCVLNMQLGQLFVHGATWRGTARLQIRRCKAGVIGTGLQRSQSNQPHPTASMQWQSSIEQHTSWPEQRLQCEPNSSVAAPPKCQAPKDQGGHSSTPSLYQRRQSHEKVSLWSPYSYGGTND
jgi:hypothetical protein